MTFLLLIIMIGTACVVGWMLKRLRENIDYENEKLEKQYEQERQKEKDQAG